MLQFPTLLLATAFLFQSCGRNGESTTTTEVRDTNNQAKENLKGDPKNKPVTYSIDVTQIDSLQYQLQKDKYGNRQEEIETITDYQIAKERLQGRVFFEENDINTEMHRVVKIRFDNGKESIINDYFSFVAYYPTEEILLCEGGHTTDVSFNLKNGKETEETGNPDCIVTSPNKLFRLNGHYGGQQCYSYFIQKKTNNEFQKIMELDAELDKQNKNRLCVVGNSFWQNDTTLYLTEEGSDINKKYFKIKLIEK